MLTPFTSPRAPRRRPLSASGGDGRATVGNITVNGDLGRIDGRGIFLLGDIRVSGGLRDLQLGGTLGQQSGLSIGPPGTALQTVTLSLGNVADLSILSGMPIRSLTVVSWRDTDGVADVIAAAWIGTLKVSGKSGNATLGIPAIPGDFEASLTLTGVGAPRGIALNSATVLGDISGTTWDITGNVGTIDVRRNVTGWTLDVHSEVRTLKLGDVADTTVTVNGLVGSVQVIRWQSGSLVAASVGTLRTTGKSGNAMLGIPATPGNWGADVTLSGMGATRETLREVHVAGEADGTWGITGYGNSIKIGSSAATWEVSFTGDLRTLTGTGTLSGQFKANSIGAVTAKNINNAEFVLHQVPDSRRLALNSITAREWMTCTRILSAWNIGDVTAGGIVDSSIFAGVLTTRDLNSDGVLDLPDSATDLDLTAEGRARIRNVRVNGMRGADQRYVDSFINTNLAAADLGAVLVSYVRTDNGGVPFGIAADTIQRFTKRDQSGTSSRGPCMEPSSSTVDGDAEVRVF